MRGDPGQLPAEAFPQVAVPAAGQRVTIAVAQQCVAGRDGAAVLRVLGETAGEQRADRLPVRGAALLP